MSFPVALTHQVANCQSSAPEQGASENQAVYAQVLIQLENASLASRVFTYKIPDEWQGVLRVGMPVMVPFASMAQQLGYVVGLSQTYTHTQAAKKIAEVLDETPLFDAAYFDMLSYVSTYYATPIHQVMAAALPSNLVRKSRKIIMLNSDLAETIAALTLPVFDQAVLGYLKTQNTPPTTQQLAKAMLAKTDKADRKKLTATLNRLQEQRFVRLVQVQEGAAREKTERMIKLVPQMSAAAGTDNNNEPKLTVKQQAVLDYLASSFGESSDGELPEKEVLAACKTTREMLAKLSRQGLIEIVERPIYRDPVLFFEQVSKKSPPQALSDAQRLAVETVMAGDNRHPYLLYGVTGSGKTEVYLHLAQKVLAEGKSVLLMVPEIALTSQLARRFVNFFGVENIALWHSHLSGGEKADTWRRLACGELRIVIAARSGIWAPLQELGLIILDEEHEASFKQDAPVPRYHAKTLAEYRARQSGAKLLLGSATPDISSYRQAEGTGRLLRLPERFGGRPMASVTVVDMKEERRSGLKGNISRALKEALKENLANQEQGIVLINRRGFYTNLQCGHCDHVIMCPDCDVSLTFHKPLKEVRCHYCAHQAQAPQFCPICASSAIYQTGVGTQRIEAEIQKTFPEARLLRMDTDTLSGKNSHHELYQKFANGEADILIGTQMVAKGLDIANVTLVGVIAADSSFSMPDFKATERGFQLLTQVAGRAGRGSKAGRVIFQSVLSHVLNQEGDAAGDDCHPVIRYASAQDYCGFYAYELEERRAFHYPPFGQLFRMIFSAESEKAVQQFAMATAAHLSQRLKQSDLSDQVLLVGPASCVIPRIQGRYRFHLMLKNLAGGQGHQLITDFYRNIPPPEGIHFHLDVDALSLL
ncbi:MAG: primosomal protein N' [Vampirovibrionales bacterium]|nr:primosomal protein N' [Vampirovibrionales bacterium]